MNIPRRIIAYYIDRIILGFINTIIAIVLFKDSVVIFVTVIVSTCFQWTLVYGIPMEIYNALTSSIPIDYGFVFAMIFFVICNIFISTLFEYFGDRATIGKKIVGLEVIDCNNQIKLRFVKILLRNIYKEISCILFYIPFLTVIIKGYVLHDKITGLDVRRRFSK